MAAAGPARAGDNGTEGYRLAVSLAEAGPRPAGSSGERAAQLRVREAFDDINLRIRTDRFRVPGRGMSRNVVGILDTPARCLHILMAHADSTPNSPGALDNASGLGALADIAPRIAAIDTRCDVWLVATGAEERVYTGRRDHMGATALVRRVRRERRTTDVRLALSLDEVGRGTRMHLRSNARTPRRGVEDAVVNAARGTGLRVTWVRDAGSGNSDHREFQIRGLPAAKLGVAANPDRHTPRDNRDKLTRSTFARVRRLLEAVLR